MTQDPNPLDIQVLLDEDGNERAYIPLDVISEEEIERLREENLEQQPKDAPKAPGIKNDADEQAAKLMTEALNEPVGEQNLADKGDGPISPADALG